MDSALLRTEISLRGKQRERLLREWPQWTVPGSSPVPLDQTTIGHLQQIAWAEEWVGPRAVKRSSWLMVTSRVDPPDLERHHNGLPVTIDIRDRYYERCVRRYNSASVEEQSNGHRIRVHSRVTR